MDRQRPSVRVSKLLSLMLRHRPQEFSLEVDRYGFADLEEVLVALQDRDSDLTLNDIELVVNDAEKKRFEIVEGRIRARYGHSFPIDLGIDPMEPPEFLYKGVDPKEVDRVLQEGLKPIDRQYVHLSFDVDVAARLGGGREGIGAVIRVDAQRGHRAGVRFYDCGPTILTPEVPADFVEVEERPTPAGSEHVEPSFSAPPVQGGEGPSQGQDSIAYGRRPKPRSRR